MNAQELQERKDRVTLRWLKIGFVVFVIVHVVGYWQGW